MRKLSSMTIVKWLKRLWNRWCRADVIIRKITPTPERDKLIYGKPRESSGRFNRARIPMHAVPTREFGGKRLDVMDYTGSFKGYIVKPDDTLVI